MALTNATTASAVAAGDTVLVVNASTGFAAGYKIELDGEVMQVAGGYSAAIQGVNVPVLRGQEGTYAYAHPTSAKVRVGAASDTAWQTPGAGTLNNYPTAGRARLFTSYSASGAITLPAPGTDLVVYLNGTSVLAMTVADPVTAQDGCLLWIASNGVAAHTVTFASGLSGAGGSYDVVTVNASAPVTLGPFMAVNALWQGCVAVPMAGTVTNITATVT